MKHWTLSDLKLSSDPTYLAQLRAPMPFPGRYPTRIAFLCPKKGSYIGKPSADQVRRLLRITAQSEQDFAPTARACEFDRGGVIWLCTHSFWGNPQLYFYYHPWETQRRGLTAFLWPYFLKSISGHRFYSYMPYLRLDQIEDYKTFYADFQRKLASPTPTIPEEAATPISTGPRWTTTSAATTSAVGLIARDFNEIFENLPIGATIRNVIVQRH